MRSSLDFSSWQSMLSTLLGLLLATLLMLGIRLVFMQTLQRKRERENRQINERLKTLIAAYKTLGSSFTGELGVDPSHLRDLRAASGTTDDTADWESLKTRTERRRRTRDAVEAALSDVILLGTEEQVALAARAAQDMVAGRTVHTAELVVSLRNFIRQALDLQPIADAVAVPSQGPVRAASGSGGSANRRGGNAGGAAGGAGAKGGGGGAGAGMGLGGGMALGAGASASAHAAPADQEAPAADMLPTDNSPTATRSPPCPPHPATG